MISCPQSQPRTPLEAAMDKILNNSPVAQEDLKVCDLCAVRFEDSCVL